MEMRCLKHKILEFDKIRIMLIGVLCSSDAKMMADDLIPQTSVDSVQVLQMNF